MKRFVRAAAMLLAVLMLISAVPMAARAEEDNSAESESEVQPDWEVYVGREFYDILEQLNLYDYYENWIQDPLGYLYIYQPGAVIKTNFYDVLTEIDDKLYDFAGFLTGEDLMPLLEELEGMDPETADYEAFLKEHKLPLVSKDIKIPDAPTNEDEEAEWEAYWNYITAIYQPHRHWLSAWDTDPTNHWKHCTVCDEGFIGLNWHQDNDADDFCDVCGYKIPYYTVSVLETENGKVTVDLDPARFRDIVNVSVEPAEGYELADIRFYKVREDESRAQLGRRATVKGESYWIRMPSFNVEIEASFKKAN